MWQVSTDDGLKTESVYHLNFDNEGRAWLGTYGGLMSYEGIEVVSHASSDLATHTATNLQFGKDGDLFYTNFVNNLYRYNAQEDSSHFIRNNPMVSETTYGDYYLTEDNEIWYAGDTRIFHGRIENDSIFTADTIQGMGKRSSILLDENEDPWIILHKQDRRNNYELTALNLRSKTGKDFEIDSTDYFLFAALRNGVLWYVKGKASNIHLLDLETGESKPFLDQEIEIIRLVNIWFCQGKVLIGTSNGLFIADQEGHLLKGFKQPLFEGNMISSAVEDREGNIWIGTIEDGTWILPNSRIVDFLKPSSTESSFIVKTIAYRDHEWLAATDDNQIIHLGKHLEVKKRFTTKQREKITSLTLDKDSNLIIGGYDGAEALDLKNGRVPKAYANISEFPNGVRDLSMGPDNTLMAGTWASCVIYHPKTDVLHNMGFSAFMNTSAYSSAYRIIAGSDVRRVFYDDVYENIWLSKPSGPVVLKKGQEEQLELLDENGEKEKCVINSYATGRDGHIWMGSPGKGLYQVKDRQIVRRIRVQNGLMTNVIMDLVRYKNELWLCTFEGLQMLNLDNYEVYSFKEHQGIGELPYSSISVNEDYVLASHKKVCLLFNKKEVSKVQVAPPIFLKKVSINGRDTLIEEAYELNYDQQNIQISFATVHYSSAKAYDFEYRIVEQGEEWQMVPGESGRVDLNGLRDGTYTFQVRAINSAGLRSDGFRQMVFTIHPAFWQTLNFQISIVLLFGLVISLIAWVRIRTLKRQSRLYEKNARIESEKQQLENKFKQAQLAALKAQLNPHFIFNALNSIQEFILLNERVQANKYLGKFADLMRFTLDNSNKRSISLKDEVRILEIYLELEGLRFEDEFSYAIEGTGQAELKGVEIPAMLIQPYVENALKHGLLHKKKNRRVRIAFELKEELLMVCIEDNGIGRKNSEKINAMRKKKHNSFAMGANAQRLELLNKGKQQSIAVRITDLYDTNQEPVGTRVDLSIPIH